jgi:A/G-specific adenine glycosylase
VTDRPSGPALAAWRRDVLAFGRRNLRPFPWRATRDPWAVLVSEVMLQQTQAPRVVERYRSFLARFPTPSACALAGAGAVLASWEGLGYNRRALALHGAALAVTDRHGGVLPDDLASLRALPGVGPYTARAVLAFAFERPVGVVDVNVARVLHRGVAGRRLDARATQELADSLVPAGRSWEWNQSMMEIGATRCRATRPRCDDCPVSSRCRWAAGGRAGADPASRPGRQGAFAGSDRQGRGRLVAAMRRGPVRPGQVAVACGWPEDPERARRIADRLVAEGLSRRVGGGTLVLP